MHSILVKDYMDENPHAVPDTMSVRQVVQFLLREKIHGAPVVNNENNLVGFISEKDCIKEALNDAFYCEESPCVSGLMNTSVTTTTPQTSIVELAQEMTKGKPKNFPVVSDGKLVGLISCTQILHAIIENNEDCYLNH